MLAGHADVVLFTGGAEEGRAAARAATERLKPVVLELGGRHPMVVLKDAPLSRAAKAAIWGRFSDGGEIRVGVGCAFVEEEIYPSFCEALEAEAGGLRQRPDGGHDAERGQMIHAGQFELALEHLRDARD